CQQESDWPRTF
nr:immunoglobulin light chain junction region [Macaca mulatta]MOV34157.1 immunoglobulin light chain junction region [Macaca mulatta]MOV34470.1 immunoglobulin light chain junction region [Macaca mulatta]MOV34673.1 immunoglobulin light chain junction region [Macaca mulatta]MOV35049.1 immunoglobulin light chain junction region [Macaca mulatta]